MTIFLVVIALIAILILVIYNSSIKLKNLVTEAWSGIDIQLKRRTDLIPNLVETVKGYAKHEQNLFENISKARTSLMQAEGPQKSASANDQLTQTIKTIFAVAEKYPELKASQHFLDLQNQLSDTEDRIAYSRQYYNSTVVNYNNQIKTVPTVILAKILGFQEAEFFKAAEQDKEQTAVRF